MADTCDTCETETRNLREHIDGGLVCAPCNRAAGIYGGSMIFTEYDAPACDACGIASGALPNVACICYETTTTDRKEEPMKAPTETEAQAWLDLRDAIHAYISEWVDINDDDTWASFKDDIDLLVNDITNDIHIDRLKG